MINGPLRPRILNDLDGSQLLSQVPLISTPFDLPQLNVRTMTLDEPTETLERFRWIRIVGGEEGLNGMVQHRVPFQVPQSLRRRRLHKASSTGDRASVL